MFSGHATTVLYAAFISALAGLALIAYFAYLVKRRINAALSRSDAPGRIGYARGLTTSLLGITFVSLAIAGFAFCAAFWTYRSLTIEIPIAQITCRPDPAPPAAPAAPARLILTIAEREGDGWGEPHSFTIEGDRWYVRGDVIEWQRFLNLLGLVSSYKINAVGGVWDDATRPASGHNMNGGPDEFVRRLMRDEGCFPYSLAVREVNGVDVHRVASRSGADEHFELAITTTKFSLKRKPGPPEWAGKP